LLYGTAVTAQRQVEFFT